MNKNKIVEYFDLASQYRPGGSHAVAEEENKKALKLHWLPQYLALLAGIIAQRYFAGYMTTGQWDPTGFLGWVVASIIVALMAFPAVYKGSFDATKPIFVQLCVIFTTGTGWQTIVGSALKAAGATIK
jgi:hypothetical protein